MFKKILLQRHNFYHTYSSKYFDKMCYIVSPVKTQIVKNLYFEKFDLFPNKNHNH